MKGCMCVSVLFTPMEQVNCISITATEKKSHNFPVCNSLNDRPRDNLNYILYAHWQRRSAQKGTNVYLQ